MPRERKMIHMTPAEAFICHQALTHFDRHMVKMAELVFTNDSKREMIQIINAVRVINERLHKELPPPWEELMSKLPGSTLTFQSPGESNST